MSTDLSDAISQQGHYAGAATRLAAFAIDQGAATAIFAVASAVLTWAITLVTAGEVHWEPATWITGVTYVVWLFLYYAYPWSVSGKTLGMALVGIRVVRADGSSAGARNAVVRTLALPHPRARVPADRRGPGTACVARRHREHCGGLRLGRAGGASAVPRPPARRRGTASALNHVVHPIRRSVGQAGAQVRCCGGR